MRTCETLFVISIFMVILTCAANGGTIYVDANATGANNGSSWGNAYIYLQDALAAAISGDNIWVAQGTYKPDHGAGVTIGDINAKFELKAGVGLYGGFPIDGGIWEQRDPKIYETLLSGDLNGNDEPDFVNREDNSKNIISVTFSSGTTIVNGFTITSQGNTDVSGAGIYVTKPGVINVVACKFINNKSRGIAFLNTDYDPYSGVAVNPTWNGSIIQQCTFSKSRYGLYIRGANPIIKNCVFADNSYDGLYCHSFGGSPEGQVYSNPTITGCSFTGNIYSGVFFRGLCTVTMMNCELLGNGEGVGVNPVFVVCHLDIRNCTIVYNQGSGVDYWMYDQRDLKIKNCIIWRVSLS